MNRVILLGNLVADVTMRTSESIGKSIARGTIAINNGTDQNGNRRDADFLRFYAFGNQAENISKYCKKGSKIAIEGRLKYRTWEKEDGTKGYETSVYANHITFLDNKNNGVPFPDESSVSETISQGVSKSASQDDPFADFGEQLSDDDLPF